MDGATRMPISALLKVVEEEYQRVKEESRSLAIQVGQLSEQLSSAQKRLSANKNSITPDLSDEESLRPTYNSETAPPTYNSESSVGCENIRCDNAPLKISKMGNGSDSAVKSQLRGTTAPPTYNSETAPPTDNESSVGCDIIRYDKAPANMTKMGSELACRTPRGSAVLMTPDTDDPVLLAKFDRIQGDIMDADIDLWHVGLWIDKTRKFYGGSQICIGIKEWAPNSKRGAGKYNSKNTYCIRTDGDIVNLLEVEPDGNINVFLLRKGPAGNIIVRQEGAPDRWLLDPDDQSSGASSNQIGRFNKFSEHKQVRDMLAARQRSQMSLAPEDRCKRQLRKFLVSRKFDYVMGSIIVLNSICLGIQSEMSLPDREGSPQFLDVLENIFLLIYVFESIVNLAVRGWRVCFNDPWYIFDVVLVVLGASYQWCLKFIRGGGGVLDKVLVFRTLRLLRLLRAFRLLRMFRVVWRLIYGLLTSANTMFSTLGLIVVILYMFACLGLELITKNEEIRRHPELGHLVEKNFASLFDSMVTLLQFVTLDSIHAVYGPLVKAYPVLLLYFLPLLLIVSVSLMNMVTAVLVEGALSQANNDREARRHYVVKKVKDESPIYKALFRQLDRDNSGAISVGELEGVDLNDFPPLFQKALQDFKFESMIELFEVLDGDVSGLITEEEFVDGLLNLSLAEFNQVPPEVILILKLSRSVTRRIVDLMKQQADMRGDLHQLYADVEQHHTPKKYLTSGYPADAAVQPKSSRISTVDFEPIPPAVDLEPRPAEAGPAAFSGVPVAVHSPVVDFDGGDGGRPAVVDFEGGRPSVHASPTFTGIAASV